MLPTIDFATAVAEGAANVLTKYGAEGYLQQWAAAPFPEDLLSAVQTRLSPDELNQASPIRSPRSWIEFRSGPKPCSANMRQRHVFVEAIEVTSTPQASTVVGERLMVASAPDFSNQHLVADGASRVVGVAFGPHPRTSVGVTALPLDAVVEVQLVLMPRCTP